MELCALEIFTGDSEVAEDCVDRARFQIATAPVRDGGPSAGGRPNPYLVVAACPPVQFTLEPPQLAGELAVFQAATMTSLTVRSSSMFSAAVTTSCGRGSPRSRQDSMNAVATLWRFSNAWAAVSPQARQPGKSGISAKYRSSVSLEGSRRTNFILYSFMVPLPAASRRCPSAIVPQPARCAAVRLSHRYSSARRVP